MEITIKIKGNKTEEFSVNKGIENAIQRFLQANNAKRYTIEYEYDYEWVPDYVNNLKLSDLPKVVDLVNCTEMEDRHIAMQLLAAANGSLAKAIKLSRGWMGTYENLGDYAKAYYHVDDNDTSRNWQRIGEDLEDNGYIFVAGADDALAVFAISKKRCPLED